MTEAVAESKDATDETKSRRLGGDPDACNTKTVFEASSAELARKRREKRRQQRTAKIDADGAQQVKVEAVEGAEREGEGSAAQRDEKDDEAGTSVLSQVLGAWYPFGNDEGGESDEHWVWGSTDSDNAFQERMDEYEDARGNPTAARNRKRRKKKTQRVLAKAGGGADGGGADHKASQLSGASSSTTATTASTISTATSRSCTPGSPSSAPAGQHLAPPGAMQQRPETGTGETGSQSQVKGQALKWPTRQVQALE